VCELAISGRNSKVLFKLNNKMMLPLPEAWKLLYMHWWTNVKAEARRD
jgi:hypothetical protein